MHVQLTRLPIILFFWLAIYPISHSYCFGRGALNIPIYPIWVPLFEYPYLPLRLHYNLALLHLLIPSKVNFHSRPMRGWPGQMWPRHMQSHTNTLHSFLSAAQCHTASTVIPLASNFFISSIVSALSFIDSALLAPDNVVTKWLL